MNITASKLNPARINSALGDEDSECAAADEEVSTRAAGGEDTRHRPRRQRGIAGASWEGRTRRLCS